MSPLAELSDQTRQLMRRDKRVGFPMHEPEVDKERCVGWC